MRRLSILVLFILFAGNSIAQPSEANKKKNEILNVEDDSLRFVNYMRQAAQYTFNNPDSSFVCLKNALVIVEENGNILWKAYWNFSMAGYFFLIGDFAAALKLDYKNINDYQQYGDPFPLALSTTSLGVLYLNLKQYSDAKEYAIRSNQICDTMRIRNNLHLTHFVNSKDKILLENFMVLSMVYLYTAKTDSALYFGRKAYNLNMEKGLDRNNTLYRLGLVYSKSGHTDSALYFFRKAVPMAFKENLVKDAIDNYIGMGNVFENKGQKDSANFYAKEALKLANQIYYKQGILEASLLLSRQFEKNRNTDSAFYYYKNAMAAKDSIFDQSKIRQVETMSFENELRVIEVGYENVARRNEYNSRIRTVILSSAAAIFMLASLFIFYHLKRKQKTNQTLNLQKERLQNALSDLKSTQSQLIQSEKMASLGELTAGIAHEIQNPLNFVNNFSEVSKELLDEMKEAMDKGDSEEAKEIMQDVINNLEKINHHGKRADGIVKGMLQHSRTSTGQKEMTDINALCDEYLRLAYHGLRAKDKSFNAKFETDFDVSLPKVSVMPQEIGRVILNLINNAFYAVSERKKLNEPGYEPTVIVSTRKENDKVEIRVKDNGTGIPKNIVDKIFQPFFTTKPTGKGTGLGLSLAYDIVKAHGGEIKVDSKEGEGTGFVIQIGV